MLLLRCCAAALLLRLYTEAAIGELDALLALARLSVRLRPESPNSRLFVDCSSCLSYLWGFSIKGLWFRVWHSMFVRVETQEDPSWSAPVFGGSPLVQLRRCHLGGGYEEGFMPFSFRLQHKQVLTLEPGP